MILRYSKKRGKKQVSILKIDKLSRTRSNSGKKYRYFDVISEPIHRKSITCCKHFFRFRVYISDFYNKHRKRLHELNAISTRYFIQQQIES